MAGNHGLPKLLAFAEKSETFSDPLGVGAATSLTLAVFAELFCSVLVILGLLTRIAAGPLTFTMLVAAFVVHAGDPFGKRELALVYATIFAALLFTGPGRLSLDHVIDRARARRARSSNAA